MAARALSRLSMPVVALDLARIGDDEDVGELIARASREAGLRNGAVVAGPVEAMVERGVWAVRALTEARAQVIVVGSRGWDPQWSRQSPLLIDAPVPVARERDLLWRRALEGAGDDVGHDEQARAIAQFRLNPEQITRAARAARLQSGAASRKVTADDLRAGARAQNAAGLERLARRIEPKVTWDDLVLPPHVVAQLLELVARVHQRDRVLGEWAMGSRSSKGHGVKALFAGDSGTGKTVSAEAVAQDLGLDLYVVDLATVVDKYIGETEKNLDRIFAEADRVNGVLLFDEADALFGKRSDVKDAHDRYANVEVAYLLQRMEQFEGLAILTTNLRSNLDEAFARRLDAIIDFPMPEEDDRRRLWECHLSPGVPRADDLDLAFLARSFKVSGGNIRNIAMTAAYLAADGGRAVGMSDLIRATEREYRKLGHLCLESEFGPYYPLVAMRPRS
jgi:SpoVK/Ycf46/Vps4 family AAA+-type ATPase